MEDTVTIMLVLRMCVCACVRVWLWMCVCVCMREKSDDDLKEGCGKYVVTASWDNVSLEVYLCVCVLVVA